MVGKIKALGVRKLTSLNLSSEERRLPLQVKQYSEILQSESLSFLLAESQMPSFFLS